MGRLSNGLGVTVAITLAGSSASAAPDGQFDVHGGAECSQHCGEWDAMLGVNGFWRARRLFALGGMFEYVNTAGEQTGNLYRFGPAVRLYPLRNAELESYFHLALGPASFHHGYTPCETRAHFFLQAGAGLELNVWGDAYAGLGVAGTLHGYSQTCADDLPPTNKPESDWEPSPTLALMLSARFGPFSEE